MLRWSPRAWVTRGGPQGRAGRWRECANPGHALPSPSRAPSAARSRPAPHAPVASLVACPHGAVPRGLVLLGQGTAASPSRLDHRGPVETHRLRGCHLQMEKKKKNHWNHVWNYSLELLCLSQVICKGKEKAKPSSWKGENAGKWSFVIVEVSSSCDKRGKKAGKSPVCGFGDVRKVTLGMDVH